MNISLATTDNTKHKKLTTQNTDLVTFHNFQPQKGVSPHLPPRIPHRAYNNDFLMFKCTQTDTSTITNSAKIADRTKLDTAVPWIQAVATDDISST